MGWSVIPLWGDARPERAKTPAVAWAQYQQALPDADTVRRWFLQDGFAGIGIVCGPVSRLAVLDFDDQALAETFARLHPDLINTLTVRSGGRGLPHYYYDLPADLDVSACHAAGVDLQAAGTYVIAPPTRIAGRAWEVEHDGPLRRLDALDLRRVTAFIAAQRAVGGADPAQTAPTDLLFVEPQTGALSLDAVCRWYRRLAQTHGRNAALFRAAAFLRDAGWTQTATAAALVDVHAAEPPVSSHVPETPQQRQREARATIASAYRYPARCRIPQQAAPDGLPNSIRERLLQLGQAAAARVLEGLRAAGIRAGQLFTEKLACRLLCAVGIGRRAVQAALRLLLPAGQPLFAQGTGQRKQEKHQHRQKKCFFVSRAKRVRISHSQQRGRPPVWFIMPANGALYRALAARPSGADPLPASSLASPRQYRQALHHALIARRPGRYSRRWLSERLGVSVWTSRRYDRASGICVTPNYLEQPVFWGNLGLVPPDPDPAGQDGTFLVDAAGKRYPPLRGIAVRLLARGQRVSLLRQVWNSYTVAFKHEYIQEQYTAACVQPAQAAAAAPAARPPAFAGLEQTGPVVAASGSPRAIAPPAEAAQECFFWLCPDCMRARLQVAEPGACRCGQRDQWERYPEALWRDNQRLTLWWRARYRRFRARQSARLQAQRQGAPPPEQPRPALSPVEAMLQRLAAAHEAQVEKLRQSPYASYFANAHQLLDPPEQPEP